MLLAGDAEREDLYSASRDGDVALVSQLLANHSFDADDTTEALSEAKLDPTLIRILRQHGADVNAVSMRMFPLSNAPGELMRLLAEYEYNFKSDGHRILQLVSTTTSSLQRTGSFISGTSVMIAKRSTGYLTKEQTSAAQIVKGSITASILQ